MSSNYYYTRAITLRRAPKTDFRVIILKIRLAISNLPLHYIIVENLICENRGKGIKKNTAVFARQMFLDRIKSFLFLILSSIFNEFFVITRCKTEDLGFRFLSLLFPRSVLFICA